MKEKLPISVVIPALNAEQFIGEAIKSVQAQTRAVAEIIVVDNGSTDRTAEIAGDLGASIVTEPARGISRARNAGIRASAQPWIALLDADDLWDECKLEQQWRGLQENPEARMAACYFRIFENGAVVLDDAEQNSGQRWRGYDTRNVRAGYSYFPKVTADFFPRFLPSCSDALIARGVFDDVGLFDENVKYNEDFEFFLRVLARYPFVLVEKALISCRRHAQKHSFNLQRMRDSSFAVINFMLKHPEKYPAGAPEVYRERLKQHFLTVEAALRQHREEKKSSTGTTGVS